ncbi:helix-turn-helix domain-containing protein [Propionibacteriaceae bacterium Y1685]|uniref:helix-turn-helix domain-containing protein n=1 Tax=Microlunatus sp. Y1700 TaxID=3418487 RepID=UPI003B8174F6
MPEERTPHEAVVINSENLRGLTHPLRMRLLGRLRAGGPSTASALAREFDTTSGDVSYHLRQLERFGFITEAERGSKRERWWQARHERTEFNELSLPTEDRELARHWTNQVVAQTIERLALASDQWRSWPEEWQPLFGASDLLLDLTPDEADELKTRLQQTIDEFRTRRTDQPAPEGTRTVVVQTQTFLYEPPPGRRGQ